MLPMYKGEQLRRVRVDIGLLVDSVPVATRVQIQIQLWLDVCLAAICAQALEGTFRAVRDPRGCVELELLLGPVTRWYCCDTSLGRFPGCKCKRHKDSEKMLGA
jgi:hypothetical protein